MEARPKKAPRLGQGSIHLRHYSYHTEQSYWQIHWLPYLGPRVLAMGIAE